MKKDFEIRKELVDDNVTRRDGSQENAPSPRRIDLRAGEGWGEGFPNNDKYEPRPCICSSLRSHNCFPAHKGWGLGSGTPQSLLNVKHSFTYLPIHLFTRKRCAFTLAEVLITLAVIGIVAAMTIPTLVQNYQEKVFITGAKKFYSLISQAVQLAVIDNGLPETWDLSDAENMIKPLMPYLKITDYCTSTNGKVCYNQPIYFKNGRIQDQKLFNGTDVLRPGFRLSDGTNVGVWVYKNGESLCGEFMVDVNGEKGPNTYGKDIFIFNLAKNGTIKPSGTSDASAYGGYLFDTNCLKSDANGLGCAAWVVQNGNMDYLHCDDLSWNGKHKCSE